MSKAEPGRLRVLFGITAVAAIALLSLGCTKRPHTNTEEALALYHEDKLEQARPLLEQIVADREGDAPARAWLAETYRRLGMKDAAIRMAGEALQRDACNSFAHTVIADACRRLPGAAELSDTDTTWVHLCEAVECDSTDGNAWASIWCEAILREKFNLMHESVRRMKESSFLTPAALAYGRWMLRTLPQDAILITNGDMDTYPPLAVQVAEGYRRDVAVVERGVLGTSQFQRFVRNDLGVPLPNEESNIESSADTEIGHGSIHDRSRRIFDGWLEQGADNSLERPITVAVTVDKSYYHRAEDHFRYAGPFLLWQSTPVDGTPDTTALAACLAGFHPEDFIGPWVSFQDRSPVRRIQAKRLAVNVTAAALAYAEALIDADRAPQALRVLTWAGEFEAMTELGPMFTQQIADLEEAAKRRANKP
jgi:tetratricopeptide (TPR) repeat protein